jgi:hypothetical protein
VETPKQATRRLLKLKDAAEYLSFSLDTLRAEIQAGNLPVVKRDIPNAVRTDWWVDVRDLDVWIEKHKSTL